MVYPHENGIVKVSPLLKLFPIYDSNGNPISSGRIDKSGMLRDGEKQEVRTYSIGRERWMMVYADGEEFAPHTFVNLQVANCRKARERGYPYDLYFYTLDGERDKMSGFYQNGVLVGKRKNGGFEHRIQEAKTGLEVISGVRTYRGGN